PNCTSRPLSRRCMLVIARGLALTYTQGRSITGLPQVFRFIGTGFIGPIPMPIILLAATFLIAALILNRTRIGQYIYAIGNNPVAARFAGIPVDRYVTLVYALSGVLAALAGMILIGRLGSAQPTAGEAYEFDAIAAVVADPLSDRRAEHLSGARAARVSAGLHRLAGTVRAGAGAPRPVRP
ncbi:MAG TPA: ABC transporter permease, partial [Aggregatilineales bacterium]|nr:ABC transporter permease [Aggregatilineales bacterium]